jgi:hydrogenase maturation protease
LYKSFARAEREAPIPTEKKTRLSTRAGHEALAPGSALAERLREPTCLAGIGNLLRRDDGVGPWIIGSVREDLAGTPISVLDVQDVPENFVHVLARAACRNVIFIDAVAAPEPPGTVVFGPLADFPEAGSFSTHRMALSFSGRFLEEAGKTVFLLGIVPSELSFGAGLTPPVARTAKAIRDFIRRAAAGA